MKTHSGVFCRAEANSLQTRREAEHLIYLKQPSSQMMPFRSTSTTGLTQKKKLFSRSQVYCITKAPIGFASARRGGEFYVTFASNMATTAGGGNLNLGLLATGASSGSGAGNLITQASGEVKVIYTYTAAVAAVPEPETYAMMLLGLGMVGAIARRRAAKKAA